MARLSPYIKQAFYSQKPLPHIFLSSGPGMGKTTLARLIAGALSDDFDVVDFSSMTPKQIYSYFRSYRGGIILADEIHRLNRSQQDSLLTLLEEGYLVSPTGSVLHIPWLTVIGATTSPEKIDPALMSRFAVRLTYDPYTDEEMALVIAKMGKKAGLKISDDDAARLGKASGGIPRTARDLVTAFKALRCEDSATVEDALRLVGIAEDGLSDLHLRYLHVLDALEGVAGERVIGNLLGCHPQTLRVTEKLLLERNLIGMTPTGRTLTMSGERRIRSKVTVEQRRVVLT